MNFDTARHNMVQRQLRAACVLDPRTLEVTGTLARERFMPPEYTALAYVDAPTPLPCGQHTMRPREEGLLLQALALQPHEAVLEIGTGCGFLSACMSQMAQRIDSIERHDRLAQQAAGVLRDQGHHNVTVISNCAWRHVFDRRYDVIVLTASLPGYTRYFERWLKPTGRLFAVIGHAPVMTATLIRPAAAESERACSLFELELDPLLGSRQT